MKLLHFFKNNHAFKDRVNAHYVALLVWTLSLLMFVFIIFAGSVLSWYQFSKLSDAINPSSIDPSLNEADDDVKLQNINRLLNILSESEKTVKKDRDVYISQSEINPEDSGNNSTTKEELQYSEESKPIVNDRQE